MTDFKFRVFYISNHLKFYQKVRSVKKNALTNFGDDIISIDGVGPHKIIRHDVKFWLRHISVINSDIALKLCKLFYFVVAIICNNNLLEFFIEQIVIYRNTAIYRRHILMASLKSLRTHLEVVSAKFQPLPTASNQFCWQYRPILTKCWIYLTSSDQTDFCQILTIY